MEDAFTKLVHCWFPKSSSFNEQKLAKSQAEQAGKMASLGISRRAAASFRIDDVQPAAKTPRE
ncbi:hypothetical protein THTE_0108 [Thermogutta terrifontis]|uniref:Uncharacterized protein n=1 Tax=Thermogutta terrifontis TaxID=1331910 RepID=A0A286R9T7_9BACT|nr:hypothetical protein THTE_0108 [Thermogutta terrifontis]